MITKRMQFTDSIIAVHTLYFAHA